MTDETKVVEQVAEVTKKVGTMTKLHRALGKVTLGVNKNAPAILTASGIVLMGAAVYTSYKSRTKVEKIVEDVEQRQDLFTAYTKFKERDESEDSEGLTLKEHALFDDLKKMDDAGKLEVGRYEYARRVTGAIAVPLSLLVLSTTAISSSYIIQNRRMQGLATALAGVVAERTYFRNKFEQDYGREELEKFETTETKEVTTTNAKGKEVTTKTQVRATTPFNSLSGRWFADSTEFTSDDHAYNLEFLRTKQRKLENTLMERGYLTFNEVLDNLGFDRVKGGGDLGYNTGSDFALEFQTTNFESTDDIIPQIYVRWTHPVSIYHDVDYNGGRYSI